jgi:NAD(P)-dependent dehydrogenase (short-subunit alcohol dehydrogenase family)
MSRHALPRDAAYATRTVVVIGGTAGLGRAALVSLARVGAGICLVARDRARGEAMLAELGAARARLVIADVSSMASVRAAAREILAQPGTLDAVLCNAAIPDWRASSHGRTDEGLNRIFANNYLGHHLFVRLLLPRLVTSSGRVVLIAGPQRFYRGAPTLDDLRFERPGAEGRAYPAAKIACFCLATELARRHPGVFTAIIDPGLVATELHRDSPLPLRILLALGLFRNEPEAVGDLYAWLALSGAARAGERGARFMSPRRELPLTGDRLVFGREVLGLEYQSALWDASAAIVGLAND